MIALIGPTGIGKSEIACLLAERMGCEILSVDSVQVFREVDIGAAKPTKEQQRRVRHHMTDVSSLRDEYSAAIFQREARAAVEKIEAAGKDVLAVGGSGLYFRALVDAFEFPPRTTAEAGVRQALEREAEEAGGAAMYEMLKKADPEAAERIHPNNTRRVIRAMEIIRTTGKPFTETYTAWDDRNSVYELEVMGITAERELLGRLIDMRTEGMFDAGLVDEVKMLVDRGFAEDLKRKSVLGYIEVLDCLEKGIPPKEAMDAIKKNTRRFAKRQMTWFKADPRVVWFERKEEDDARAIADRLESYLRRGR